MLDSYKYVYMQGKWNVAEIRRTRDICDFVTPHIT